MSLRRVAASGLLGLLVSFLPARAQTAEADLPPIPDRELRHSVLIPAAGELPAPPERSAREAEIAASQDDFDVTRYWVSLDFDEQLERVEGFVEITGTSLTSGLQHVVLDLKSNMAVSVVTQGIPLLAFSRVGDLLDVTLPQPLASGQSFTFKVSYSGKPLTGSDYFGWNKYFGGNGDNEMVWSLSEPYGARYWWPCKDRPDDKAIVEEWWTVRADWVATGNGKLLGVDDLPGPKKRYRWLATNPLTTYLVSVAATNYVSFSHAYTPIAGGSMPIDYYVYPEDLTDAQVSYSATPAMVEYYADAFGEYPFVADKYGMSSFPFGGAMEHSTNTSYGHILINGAHTYDFVIAHELAHQWWGDSVSPETWLDIWLNEGFATYSEALWFEHLGGAASYQSYMQGLWSPSFSGPVYDPNQLFSSTTYDKGAWVLHMLRGVIGDAALFQTLRTWYDTRKDGVGNTAQFQALAESIHGDALDWFFAEWVYGEQQPRYQYGFKSANLGNGSWRNYIRIMQTHTDAPTFTMPVRLLLTKAGGGTELRTVWNDGADEDFILDTTAQVTAVGFDSGHWILEEAVNTFTLPDGDSDNVPDRNDNCPVAANSNQANFDGDALGDVCDADDDGDTLDDVVDCAPLDPEQGTPAEVAQLMLGGSGEPTTLNWTAAARADTYDVSRGLASGLPANYGTCLAPLWAGLSYVDADVPAPGQSFVYLVRGHDAGCGGGGSTGVDSTGAPRPSPCP